MKRLLSILILFLSLSASAQTLVIGPAVRRPTLTGTYTLSRNGVTGLLELTPRTGSPFLVRVHPNQVFGLTGMLDSLRALSKPVGYQPDTSGVIGLSTKFTQFRTQSNNLYKPLGYVPTYSELTGKPTAYPTSIPNVVGLPDSLGKKLNVTDFQAVISGAASTSNTYNQTQVNGFLNLKANQADVTSFSANTYNKTAVDSKLAYSSAKDLATAGGFTLDGTLTTDQRTALQYVLNNPGPSNGVRLPVGIYYVSGPLDIPATRSILFDFGAQIRVLSNFATESLAGNDGRYVLRVRGANVTLTSINIDCMGLQAAPIMLLFADDVTVQGCNLRNWRIGDLGQHGIAVLASKRARVLYNTLTNGEHGINVYRSDGTISFGNFIDVMVHGGIYCVFTGNFSSTDDFVSNCGDVGKDSEGGYSNFWTGGMTTRCKNGELAIFSGANADSYTSHNLKFDCDAIRVGQYTTMNATGTTSTTAACDATYGAANFMSLDEGVYDSGFEGCGLTISFGLALYHNTTTDKNNRSVFFRRNAVTMLPGSTAITRILSADGLDYSHNAHDCKSGTESHNNEMRDMHNSRISYNEYRYEVAKTTGWATQVNTSSTFATIGTLIDHNVYYNAGAFALQCDPFNNGALVATIWGNELGATYTSNGGLSITANASSGVKFRDQPVRVLLAEGANNIGSILPYLERAGGLKAVGNVSFGNNEYNGALSHYAYLSGTGSFVTTLATKASLDITAPSNVLQLTRTGSILGGSAQGFLDMTLNSY